MTSPQTLARVFVLGSSVTIHFGPYLEQELQGSFHYDRKRDTTTQRAQDNLDIPQGASAGDSGMVLSYLKYCRQHQPIPADILLLSCGLHDLKKHSKTDAYQVPLDTFESNLRQIVDETRAMNLKLSWLRIGPVVDEIHNSRVQGFRRFSADVAAYNAAADRVMTDGGAHVIDFHTFCLSLIPAGYIDHIHYDEAGRQAQAKFIADELSRHWLPWTQR